MIHACCTTAREESRARAHALSNCEVFPEKGEITEVRKECETERRTLNGIRIGRVPSISSWYYVIAPFLPATVRLTRRAARLSLFSAKKEKLRYDAHDAREETKFSREWRLLVQAETR